jgi:P pilus assembly chaperone PapD
VNLLNSIHILWRLALLIPTLFLGTPQLLAQEISVSPARVFFKESGSEHVYSQRVLLQNSSAEPIIFKSSLSDWKRDSVGNKRYFPAGTLPLSNATWVEVQPNVVEIQPHAKQEVTVILHVPQSATKKPELTHSMLFLTQLNAHPSHAAVNGKTNIGVVVKLEFGIHIYYTPEVPEVKNLDFINVTEKELTADNRKIHRVGVKVKNTGNVVTDGFLRFEVTEKSSGKELKFPEKPVSILPGDEQTVFLDMPASLKGSYLIIALLDSGEQTNLKVAKKELLFN